MISKYVDYFHDGNVVDIIHEGNEMRIIMKSSEIDPKEVEDPSVLSQDYRIKLF